MGGCAYAMVSSCWLVAVDVGVSQWLWMLTVGVGLLCVVEWAIVMRREHRAIVMRREHKKYLLKKEQFLVNRKTCLLNLDMDALQY